MRKNLFFDKKNKRNNNKIYIIRIFIIENIKKADISIFFMQKK